MQHFSLKYKLLVLTVLAFFVWAVAAEIPFTFKAGDVISAEQMNQNFVVLNNSKQELVTGTCAAGSSIRVIAADGSVTCEVDDIGSGGSGAGVDAINGMTGAVTLQAGDNITIDDSQQGQLRISSSTGGTTYEADGSSLVLNGTTFSIKDGGVSTAKLADGAVTANKISVPLLLTGNPQARGLEVNLGVSPLNVLAAIIGNTNVGEGIRGVSTNFSGVRGLTVNGNGVWGESQNSTGVYGLATTGAGVWGDSTSGFGVRGRSDSGNGVHGESTSNDAVVGISKSSAHAGIVGVNTTGYAAYFEAGSAVCSFKAGTTGWACSSDYNLKEHFEPVNSVQILESVAHMPITTWTMKGSTTRQMGPTAQDFYAAFNLGDSDKTINNTDIQGVALAAIQGLYQVVQEQQAKIEELEKELATLQNN